LKLGRKFPTHAKLKLAKYLGPALPAPPAACDWTLAMTTDWGVMRNDALGDCTCAAMGHAVQVVTSNGDGLVTPSDSDVVTMYEASGYGPSDPSTDQGWTETAAMQFMCDRGLAGVKLDAFADVDQTDLVAVKQTISLFGGIYIGVQITQADMDAFQSSLPWTDSTLANVLGGHALWIPTYDADRGYAITWGKIQPFTWGWFGAKCDEGHACLFFPWVQNSVNCDPDGFDLHTLVADLKSL
jgi:hypothetical protein